MSDRCLVHQGRETKTIPARYSFVHVKGDTGWLSWITTRPRYPLLHSTLGFIAGGKAPRADNPRTLPGDHSGRQLLAGVNPMPDYEVSIVDETLVSDRSL